jgi:hypothetical protein
VGQGRPISVRSFFDRFDRRYPLKSLYNNVIKEIVKFALSAFGNERYGMRRRNELVRVTRLDDGQAVFEFMRSSQCFYGLYGKCATMDGLADTLREEVLKRLIEVGGYMIVYTHLGVNGGVPYIPPNAAQALRSLSEKNHEGSVWVPTTSRLLRYYVNKKYLKWEFQRRANRTRILIHSTEDPVRGSLLPSVEALGGLTFYVVDPVRTEIVLGGREIADLVRNGPDERGEKERDHTLAAP